ncbi:MAG: hypothetical protein H6922_02105 [Pseudomonadaceae bacterium]|nr:hypothetical protein [Pseudomonadaceae bacterium]
MHIHKMPPADRVATLPSKTGEAVLMVYHRPALGLVSAYLFTEKSDGKHLPLVEVGKTEGQALTKLATHTDAKPWRPQLLKGATEDLLAG